MLTKAAKVERTADEIITLHHNGAVYDAHQANQKNNIPSKIAIWNGRELYLISSTSPLWYKIQNLWACLLELLSVIKYNTSDVEALYNQAQTYFTSRYSPDKEKELNPGEEFAVNILKIVSEIDTSDQPQREEKTEHDETKSTDNVTELALDQLKRVKLELAEKDEELEKVKRQLGNLEHVRDELTQTDESIKALQWAVIGFKNIISELMRIDPLNASAEQSRLQAFIKDNFPELVTTEETILSNES